MRRLVLIAALALASASVQAGGSRSLSRDATPNDAPVITKGPSKSSVLAGDSRSLSSGATANDSTATTNAPSQKSGAISAQTGGTATTTPAATPPVVETPRYAPPPGYVPPPAPPATETPKAVDTTRNTETPVQNPVQTQGQSPAQTTVQAPAQTPVQTPAQTSGETQTPRYTARPAPVEDTPSATTSSSSRQHMPSREARDWHGRGRHSDYYGSGWSDYRWDYRRPRFRTPHWSSRRILAALHRYGFFW